MRRHLTAAVLLLASTLPATAEDRKLNTLTPKEISDGWVLLFDGETTFGWKLTGPARVKDGVLTLGGDQPTTAEFAFGRCELTWEFVITGAEPDFKFRPEDGAQSASIGVGFSKTTVAGQAVWNGQRLTLNQEKGRIGTETQAGTAAAGADLVPPPGMTSHSILTLPTLPAVATLTVPAGSTFAVRNVKMRPLGLKPIFNGKDLTGWKEIPGKKSKFTVTGQGELNVQDGNGDLQTEGQWADFVLQLDCLSRGDHLNSGVFFRARPGEFWSGYEAQVRNEWISEVKLKDGTTVEGSYTAAGDQVKVQPCEQVPGQNNWRPKGTAKTYARADVAAVVDHRDRPVDIGTGGIYNRRPARRVVSSDRAWFTLTVVAHGTHLATWVNGYPVADYVDTAPLGDNARKGAKVTAGPISLQGHDPTTDLMHRPGTSCARFPGLHPGLWMDRPFGAPGPACSPEGATKE